jgi:sRNA-binding regulator protein Hfq
MAKRTLREAAAAILPQPTVSPNVAVLDPPVVENVHAVAASKARKPRALAVAGPVNHHGTSVIDEHGANRQAELFYLQKQIQQQTQMVFILEDKSRIQGVIEWYDRNAIKVRGKSRVLIYKSAIKYLYKAGEVGTHTD